MTRSRPRSFPLRIGAALAAALLLFCLPAAASDDDSTAPAVTDALCDDRWGDSEAADTCTDKSITAEGEMCRIVADCPKPLAVLIAPHPPIANNILATPDNVAQLHNCIGVLTVGSC